jgi:hypothetical protein
MKKQQPTPQAAFIKAHPERADKWVSVIDQVDPPGTAAPFDGFAHIDQLLANFDAHQPKKTARPKASKPKGG